MGSVVVSLTCFVYVSSVQIHPLKLTDVSVGDTWYYLITNFLVEAIEAENPET
jgi:hypothetical protein